MRVRGRGQITIPKALRDRYGLHKDVEIELVPEEQGIRISKRIRGQHPVERIRGIVKLQFSDSVDEYIEEIRGR